MSEITDSSLSPDLPPPTMDDIRRWVGIAKRQGLQEGYEAAREQAAKKCAMLAEEIKHTSHKDGLGMGDQRSEQVCERLEAAIRAMKPEGEE